MIFLKRLKMKKSQYDGTKLHIVGETMVFLKREVIRCYVKSSKVVRRVGD